MAKMFSSLRLATMRTHKKQRPGSVTTTASSDSGRTDDTANSANQSTCYSSNFIPLEQLAENVCTQPSSVTSKVVQIRIERENGNLGVTLRGGVSRALVVTAVKPDGPAAKEGRVRPGDRLLAIDDTELRGLTLTEAQRALRKSASVPTASLTIEYDVAHMTDARSATDGPLLVQLERGTRGELGLTVRETQMGVFIDSLRPASTAERCGALQPGDKILVIDDVAIYDATTAAKLLRGGPNSSHLARIHILPQAVARVARSPMLRLHSPSKSRTDLLQTQERLSVTLRPDHRGLGLVLKPSEDHPDYVIELLEPGGPAERSGVLLPGDKVVAMNRRNVRDMQPMDVALMLESPKVELLTEYSVGNAILPTSGVFTIRVARPENGQPDLGITVNENLIITDIRKGSLAYRTGSLSVGDQLLAIDGQQLNCEDLGQAVQLLHSPGSSVVALVIRKPDSLASKTYQSQSPALTSIPEVLRKNVRESSISSDAQCKKGVLKSDIESLPSVDSAVDSWGELGEPSCSVSGVDMMKLWETSSIDSGQLDLPMPPYPGCSSPQDFLISEPHHQQIMQVILNKDPVYEDFGFSVSDGLYEKGVYINRLRPGGPCDGILRPFDRILRVGDVSTEDCDCCLTVPLIASAGPNLELTVARPVFAEDMD